MWKQIRKMCLFIFVFDYRRKKKTSNALEDEPPRPASTKPPKLQRSAIATVVDSPPIQDQRPLKEVTEEGAGIPKLPGAIDCEAAPDVEAGSIEKNTMAPRPGSPLRPHLGARWTSKHLSTFKHPFMPPPADQVSLASTASDREPSQAEPATSDMQPESAATRGLPSDGSTLQTRACPDSSIKLEMRVTAASSTAAPVRKRQASTEVAPERPTTPTDACSHLPEMDMHKQELRRNRDDDVSLFTMPSTISGFSIAPTLESDTTPEASKTPDAKPNDDKSVSSFEIVDMEDEENSNSSFEEITMEDVANMQWSEDADRYLCVLWFFTAYSLNTIAALLSYTLILDQEIKFDGEAVRWRICELMQQRPDDPRQDLSDSRPSMYHGVKRSSQTMKFNPSERCHKLEAVLRKAWRALQRDLEEDKRKALGTHWKYRDPPTGVYKVGVGTDDLSDQGLTLAGLRARKWSPEMRDYMRELQWTGLQKLDGHRPVTLEEVERMSLNAGGSARSSVSDQGKRRSWFGAF